MDDVADAFALVVAHLRSLVEQHDVAELNLLDEEVLDVFFLNVAALEVFATGKLALHPQCVDHCDNAVEAWNAMLDVLLAHVGNGADGLRDGLGLAYSARLDDDVVKAVELHDVVQLLDKVHLESAADASVLQCHQTLVFLPHDSALLDEARIDVNLSQVIDNDGKFYVLLISENMVYKRCLSAAQITREQQYGCFFHCFYHLW